MMQRIDGPTPNGGAYSKCFWLNDAGEGCEPDVATQRVINEYDVMGAVISSTMQTLDSGATDLEEALAEVLQELEDAEQFAD